MIKKIKKDDEVENQEIELSISPISSAVYKFDRTPKESNNLIAEKVLD